MSRTDDDNHHERLLTIYDLAIDSYTKYNHNKYSIDVFNMMLTQCLNDKNWKLANKIWNDLQSLQIKPDSISYVEYLQCNVYSLKFPKIPQLINEIISKQRNNEKFKHKNYQKNDVNNY